MSSRSSSSKRSTVAEDGDSAIDPGCVRPRDIVLAEPSPPAAELTSGAGSEAPGSVVRVLHAGAADRWTRRADAEHPKTPSSHAHGTSHDLAGAAPLPLDAAPFDLSAHLLGNCPAMLAVRELVERAAPTDATVFVTGETGTGKELVAEALHALSRRAYQPLVCINCGALAPNLIESELFGHEKGSFTGADRRRLGAFERADGGTLFLDEIAEMPPEIQVKMLRVLESRTLNRVGGDETIQFDVRMIAATNRNPEQAVRDGRLREDLFYRLMVVGIELPPLRDRGDDIRLLAEHFVESLGARYDAAKRVTAAELREQGDYRWPGNVRELRNLVERALALGSDEIVLKAVPGAIASSVAPRETLIVGSTIADVEYRLIVATLSAFQGNKPKAARTLGISLKTLYNRLNAYRVA